MDVSSNLPFGLKRLPTWFLVFAISMGFYVLLPFLAPVFMSIGWNGAGKAIYFVYSFLCHQLPQRSYFLFGPEFTYSLAEIQAAWQDTNNPLLLRQFIGSPEMGWKVAWSDRMVSMFTSTWIFGLLWYPVRKLVPKLPFWGLVLFLLPMGIDGITHFISDFWGIGQGFRDSNLWLAILTNRTFSSTFYAGDAWGSFNATMRLLSGVSFGLGIVWFGFPYISDSFPDNEEK